MRMPNLKVTAAAAFIGLGAVAGVGAVTAPAAGYVIDGDDGVNDHLSLGIAIHASRNRKS